jgi:hypothetical protein
MYDYISILAGGRCAMNCSFCVGKKVRTYDVPHFADHKAVANFISCFGTETRLFSVSGSTSDPLLTDLDLLFRHSRYAQLFALKTSLHTAYLNILLDHIEFLEGCFDEFVLSIHSKDQIPQVMDILEDTTTPVRISSVYHKDNKDQFDRDFFESIPVEQFTIRKNVFEVFEEYDPVIPYPELDSRIFGQKVYGDHNKKIAVWDFKEANRHIRALYLWSNGMVK